MERSAASPPATQGQRRRGGRTSAYCRRKLSLLGRGAPTIPRPPSIGTDAGGIRADDLEGILGVRGRGENWLPGGRGARNQRRGRLRRQVPRSSAAPAGAERVLGLRCRVD